MNVGETIRIRWKIWVFGPNPRWTLIRLLCLLSFSFVTFNVVFFPIKVSGSSMEPTYHNGRVDFVNKLAYVRSAPKRGDVVTLRESDNSLLIKRIVGLPGDELSFTFDGRLRINGRVLVEPYIHSRIPWRLEKVHLGPDDYYVYGDNRPVSVFGVISRSQIVGKVIF